MTTPRERALLRAILRQLIAERDDAELLYIPRGEAGLRRMIDALLFMRQADAKNDALDALLQELDSLAQRRAHERTPHQRANALVHEPAVDEQQ